MREILFRGKRKDKWVYGYYNYCGKNNVHEIISEEYDYIGVSVDKETIGQFTGILDKNGVKIFEGDLVRYKNGTSTPINIVHEGKNLTAYESNYSESYIVFYNGCFSLHNEPTTENHQSNSKYNRTSYSGGINKYHGFEYEIIGNINDNNQ